MAILRSVQGAFRGAMRARFGMVVVVAIVAGTAAGIMPVLVGSAVARVAGFEAATPVRGIAGWLLERLAVEQAWAAVALVLLGTVLTVGLGVLSSKLGTSLSGDVTAALRVKLVETIVAAGARDVAAIGAEIAQQPIVRPGGAAAKRPPGKALPSKGTGATHDAAVKLAVSRDAALVSDFAVSVFTAIPQSVATLAVLGGELIVARAWLVLGGGVGLFVLSRLAADRAASRVAAARGALQRADAAVFGSLQEVLGAHEDLRLMGAGGQLVGEFAETTAECAQARARFATALAVSGQIRRVFTAMAPLLIVVALKVSGRSFGPGAVAALLLMVPLLMVRLEALDALRQGMLQRGPMISTVRRLLGLPPSPARAAQVRELELETVRGHLQLEAVSCRAPGSTEPLLHDVSLEVPAGSVVGICGASGSGKSTLLRLLLRLDEPDSGSIKLDGHSLSDIEPAQLPRLFSVVRQTSKLLQRSVGDNLSLGLSPRPDDESKRRVLRAVGLPELAEPGGPRGLDTQIVHAPPSFSGGERRRLLIARMLLQDAPVRILDEPEAGLPSATAEAILRELVAAGRGCTQLVVTHAPQLLQSDFNIMMVDGTVVATGTHEELVARCAAYRELLAADAQQASPALQNAQIASSAPTRTIRRA